MRAACAPPTSQQARQPVPNPMQGKMEQAQRDELIQKGQQLKETVAAHEAQLGRLENALQWEAQRLPNLTHPDVAVGGEEDAPVVQEVGGAAHFDFEVRRLRCSAGLLAHVRPAIAPVMLQRQMCALQQRMFVQLHELHDVQLSLCKAERRASMPSKHLHACLNLPIPFLQSPHLCTTSYILHGVCICHSLRNRRAG